MSQLLINDYLNDLATLKRVSGAQRESVVREAFKDLLKRWGKTHNLVFIPEHEFITTAKVRNYVDGALMHDLRVPFGYWEAKDVRGVVRSGRRRRLSDVHRMKDLLVQPVPNHNLPVAEAGFLLPGILQFISQSHDQWPVH